MLATLRRCSASVPRLSRCVSATARPLHPSPLPSGASVQSVRSSQLTFGTIRALSSSAQWRQQETATDAPPKIITDFQELGTLGLVHPNVIKNITEGMGLSKMTDVQTATINEALSGVDLVGQARTGTGKTLAFLMPIFQRIIAQDPSLATRSYGRTSASDIRAIVISPTRELAEQIAVEARRISKGTGVIVQAAVGGTRKVQMLYQTRREGCHILVATPGRLADLLSDPSSGIDAPKLNMFVLDEADRLLDQGFWQEITQIRRMLPEPRENNVQTLMFSATIPREVVSAVRDTLKPGFRFVKCVRDDDEPTHERVPQMLVRMAGMENSFPALYELCMREIQQRESNPDMLPFKAIVYFNSTAMVELASEVFRELQRGQEGPLRSTRIYHMHSKLSQGQRTSASDSFRRSPSGILLSSDVTARGMDFPNVTHVVQVGVPSDGEQYVHRIGRTARAGKEGIGYLLIHPLEEKVARSRLSSLPLKPDTSLESAQLDLTREGEVPQRIASILSDLSQAHRAVDRSVMADAYKSLLGTHSHVADKQDLIESMNAMSKYSWGLERPPALSQSTVHKLGLSRVQGLNLSGGSFGGDFGGRRGGSFGSGGDNAFGGARRSYPGNDGVSENDPFGLSSDAGGIFSSNSRGRGDRGKRRSRW